MIMTKNEKKELTLRQRQCFNCIMAGYDIKQTAKAMGIKESTVKLHRNAVLDRFQVDNTQQLLAIYVKLLKEYLDNTYLVTNGIINALENQGELNEFGYKTLKSCKDLNNGYIKFKQSLEPRTKTH